MCVCACISLSENQCRAILYVIYHFSENSNRRKVGKKQEQTPQASKQNSSKKEEGNKEAIKKPKIQERTTKDASSSSLCHKSQEAGTAATFLARTFPA